MRIADEFRRSVVRAAHLLAAPMLPTATIAAYTNNCDAVIDVQNVADFLFESSMQEEWIWAEHFPCLTPPFKQFLLTYKVPATSKSIKGTHPIPDAGAKIFICASAGEYTAGVPTELRFDWFVKYVKNEFFIGPFMGMWKLSAEGRAVGAPLYGSHGDIPQHLRANFAHVSQIFAFAPCLAISLMHCKNVSLVSAAPLDRLQRARQRRGDTIPFLHYHTLEISAIKRDLTAAGAETIGLPKALHICRGHFKDYQQSGLFGKHKGLFWWDAFARGEQTAGIVDKDYSISAEGK